MEPTILEPVSLPTEDGAWLEWVRERATTGLATAVSGVAAPTSAPAGDSTILHVWNDLQIARSGVFALCSLMSVVHPEPEVMEAAESFEIEARKFSTDYPDALPVLTHARAPEARRAVAHSFLNIGWPGNEPVLAELLAVREEKARLLGCARDCST